MRVPEGYEIGALALEDAAALAAAYRRNREHLAATDPERPEEFYTEAGQAGDVAGQVAAAEQGRAYTWVVRRGAEIVGRALLTNIVRGPLQTGTVGYWIDHEHLGKGLAKACVEHVAIEARRLGLHRLEAGTLVDNAASQAVLRGSGFSRYGLAERFLFVRGEWRDHVLFQRILHDDPPA